MAVEKELGVKIAAGRRSQFELGINGITDSDLAFAGKILYKAPYNDQWGEHEGT